MKRIRTSFHFALLLAATVLLFGIFLNTAQAQNAGPLKDILDRMDAVVLELENPSFGDKIKDAIEMKLCGHFTLPEGEFELSVGGEIQSELGGGVGPNIMGTGLALKIEPELTAQVGLALGIQTDLTTETCIEIGDLAELIGLQDEAAAAGTDITPASLNTSMDPLEAFVNNLNPDARAQILDFADQSTVPLLELFVLLLEEAGIDPIARPDSLANILLAPVEEISTYEMGLSLENALDLEKVDKIVDNIPFGTGLKGTFKSSMDALTSLGVEDLNPCGIDFLEGLEDLQNEVCGIESLFNNYDGYVYALERVGGTFGVAAKAKEVKDLAGYVKGAIDGTDGINAELNALFGDVDEVVSYVDDLSTLYTDLKTKVCRDLSANGPCIYIGTGCYKAKATINPCTASTSIGIHGCSCW
jgi:hypothetical protein